MAQSFLVLAVLAAVLGADLASAQRKHYLQKDIFVLFHFD